MDLAPAGRKAAMFGLYYLMRDTVVSIAAFGGGVLGVISPPANFLAGVGLGVIGTVSFAVSGKRYEV
jgi:hypothetical protein